MTTTGELLAYADTVFNQGTQCLGTVVWHSVPDLRVTEGQLRALGAAHGLSEVPKLGNAADAFRRATTPAQVRGEGRHTRYLMRPVTDEAGEIVRHVVAEQVNAAGQTLNHSAAAALTFHRASATMTSRWLRPSTSTDELGTVNRLLDEAKANFAAFTQSLTGPEVTRFLMKQLAGMAHVTVHPHGHVYFVPFTRRTRVLALQAFTRALAPYVVDGSSPPPQFWLAPIPDLPEPKRMVEAGFRASAAQEIKSVMADVAEMLARKGRPSIDSVEERIAEIGAARRRAEEYADLLQADTREIDASIAILEAQAAELMDRATSNADALMETLKARPELLVARTKGGVKVRAQGNHYREVAITFARDGWTLRSREKLVPGLMGRAELKQLKGGYWSAMCAEPDVAVLFINAALGIVPVAAA